MADVFTLGTYSDAASYSSDGTSKDTGDLRRRYNFGDRVSELAIAQDPFFRFVSKVAKKPTDDPEFKFTERRPSYHKRYAYVMGAVNSSGADYFGDSEIIATNDGGAGTSVAQGDTVKLYMAGDINLLVIYKMCLEILIMIGRLVLQALDLLSFYKIK